MRHNRQFPQQDRGNITALNVELKIDRSNKPIQLALQACKALSEEILHALIC